MHMYKLQSAVSENGKFRGLILERTWKFLFQEIAFTEFLVHMMFSDMNILFREESKKTCLWQGTIS